MLAPYCTGHRPTVLLPRDAINAIDRAAHGFQIDFTCTSAHRGRDTIRAARTNHQG